MRTFKIILPIFLLCLSFIAYTLFVRPHIYEKDINRLLNGKTILEFKILKWQTSTPFWGPHVYKKAIVEVTVSEKEYYLLNIESYPWCDNGYDKNIWRIPGIFLDYFPVDSLKYSTEPKTKDIQEFINQSSYQTNGINQINLW